MDTCSFIYLIEQSPKYSSLLRPLFQRIDSGQVFAVSSVVTLIEVLAKPLQLGNQPLAAEYRRLLTRSRGFELVSVDRALAEESASIRARFHFRTPDAIQLATARQHGAAAFVTNDRQLQRYRDVEVLVLDDFAPNTPGS